MTTTDPYPPGAFGGGYVPPQAADTTGQTFTAQPTVPAPPQQGHAPAQPAGPPVFGRRTGETRRIPFSLATYDQRGAETLHPLTALAIADMGSVFGFGRSGSNTRAQLAAIRNLLMRTLVDDDGIGLHDGPVQVVFQGGDDSSDYSLLDELTDDARREALAEAVWCTREVVDAHGQVLVEEAFHDDEETAAAYAREHGSSLRRFTAIMDDDSLIVMNEALEQIVDYIMTEASDRPTRRSSPSSRSRPRKGR